MESAQLLAQADRIRASDALGRSDSMRRLFDFLIECSLAGRVPKEIELAIDVFGKDESFAATQDAMVRVYIHKLRRKLEEYYAGSGCTETQHLVIPKGEYRVLVATPPASTQVTQRRSAGPARIGRSVWIAGAALLMLANVSLWFLTRPRLSPAEQELADVRGNPVWAPLLDDGLPIYVVVGDYYLFGELDVGSLNVHRLVREFDINSRSDLDQYLMNNPELANRYMDVSLQYLPISVANALQSVTPILQSEALQLNGNGARNVQVVLASDVTPSMIKSSHIVYVGLISGMGVLSELAFAGSQFKVGSTYDELVDRHSGRHYVSEASSAMNELSSYRDFGYFSTLDGPSGNRIVILAGTRDVALMHTAEALTHRSTLQTLTEHAGVTGDFEALYSIEAMGRTNLEGRLISTGRIEARDRGMRDEEKIGEALVADVDSVTGR